MSRHVPVVAGALLALLAAGAGLAGGVPASRILRRSLAAGIAGAAAGWALAAAWPRPASTEEGPKTAVAPPGGRG